MSLYLLDYRLGREIRHKCKPLLMIADADELPASGIDSTTAMKVDQLLQATDRLDRRTTAHRVNA